MLSAKPYLWALGLLWGLPLLVVAGGYLVLPKDGPDEQCGGLGILCGLSPAETLLLWGLLASAVLVPLGVVAVALISLVQRRRRGPVPHEAASGRRADN